MIPLELPDVAAPMVNPVTVNVFAVDAAMAAVAVVITISVAVGVATLPDGVTSLNTTSGDPEVAKKPDGYVSVMLLPAASAPPAVVLNDKVTAAFVLPATRSDAAIKNEVSVT